MNIEKLAQQLHPLERKVVPFLARFSSFNDLVSQSNMKDVEVMRALQWLENKGVLKINEKVVELVELSKNGEKYKKDGLPEKRFLEVLKSNALTMVQISDKAKLSKEELNACLGSLRRKAAVMITKEKNELVVKALPQASKLLSGGFLEEKFLDKEFPVELNLLQVEEKFALDELKKRKEIISIESKKDKSVELTMLGKELLNSGIQFDNVIDRLTKEMLKKGSWKGKKFRSYDIKINVPSIYGAKKQHYRRFLDEVRGKFLALGFSEMFGPIVETDFWDMDALFMPQFHSARDIHSAYYIKEPKTGKLDEALVKKVKAAHENGGGTGSKGWGYDFDLNKTKQQLLRKQGTALSARMLASKDLKIPGKYFGVARCFRPDVVDATHAPDFNQVEGIVIEVGLIFSHLKGLL